MGGEMKAIESRKLRTTLMGIAAAVALCQSAQLAADNKPQYFDTGSTPKDIANFLFPVEEKTRSWAVVETEPTVLPKAKPAAGNDNVVAMKILFEFDSADIKPEAVDTIELLAQSLITHQADGKPVWIEGHTDSIGTKQYNKQLSKRRAAAVKTLLVENYGIEPERLFVIGKGEVELFEPNRPKSGINRRVQIKAYRQ